MNRLFRSALAIVLLLAISSVAVAQTPYAHLAMGNPSGAKEDASDKDNYLMKKPYFAVSYNNSKGMPNWVSWHLTAEELGKAKRFSFYPDDTLPDGFNRIVPKDYTNSGFDRGHMCPHSDRNKNLTLSKATFVMTNIIPQAAGVNRHAWEQLEIYCRNLVTDEDKELYIISGPAEKGGHGSNGFKTNIANGKVTVPAHCWKIILVLDKSDGDDPSKDAARVDEQTRIIAVNMPNVEGVGEDWSKFRTSVKEIEQLTSFKFFDKVPDNIIGPIKDVVDDEDVDVSEPVHHGSQG
jgi:endonuclease G